jgi:hypothetical protein
VEAVVDGATLFHEQTGAGPDIVRLAAGDHPGASSTPAFEPGFRNTTYDAASARHGRTTRRRGRSRRTPATAPR